MGMPKISIFLGYFFYLVFFVELTCVTFHCLMRQPYKYCQLKWQGAHICQQAQLKVCLWTYTKKERKGSLCVLGNGKSDSKEE